MIIWNYTFAGGIYMYMPYIYAKTCTWFMKSLPEYKIINNIIFDELVIFNFFIFTYFFYQQY